MRAAKILVVDDEPGILKLVKAALEPSGLEIMTSGDGSEALDVLQSHNGEIAVVLSDIRMPGMSGPQLVRKVVEKSPATAVAFMSSCAANEILDSEIPLLRKPFDIKTLRDLVNNLFVRHKEQAKWHAELT